jgi:hypothetical protein
MTVDLKLSDVYEMELSIPHYYVLGITHGYQDNILGFHDNDFTTTGDDEEHH